MRDNDGYGEPELLSELDDLISDKRRVFIGSTEGGPTLEPQIVKINDEPTMREILGITKRANVLTWMTNNKTEAAIRIAGATKVLNQPSYFSDAIEFVDALE